MHNSSLKSDSYHGPDISVGNWNTNDESGPVLWRPGNGSKYFVGILTAYLVTRLSDLKSQRSRLEQRITSIDAELRVLDNRFDFRVGQLEATEERWRLKDAEDAVDNFIEYDVGRDWGPDPDDITVEDSLNALVIHRGLDSDDLIQRHREEIEDRWDEIIDELQPSHSIYGAMAAPNNDIYTASGWIQETLWDIYEREKYESQDLEAVATGQEIKTLQDEREVLVGQYKALDPQQLEDSIKSAIVPIGLSVVLPLFIRFLHEVGLVVDVSPSIAIWEPTVVLVLWLIGFIWTLLFVWVRVSDTDDELSESPIPDGKYEMEESEGEATEEPYCTEPEPAE